MSGRGGKRHRDWHGDRRDRRSGGHPRHRSEKKEDTADVDESSPVIQMFRQYQQQLDRRHDKYERLVKLSRDVTIESKRIIFLLHRITGGKREEVLAEAEQKLGEVQASKWKAIAQELTGEDPYQFIRAYSGGLQEYVEAISFYHYLKSESLISLELVQNDLIFKDTEQTSEKTGGKADAEIEDKAKAGGETPAESSADTEGATSTSPPGGITGTNKVLTVQVHIPPIEYVLGVADLTGELMRMAISSVGAGDLDLPFRLCAFMRQIHDVFVTFGNISRELPRKMTVLRQSVQKVETACYTVQVRGSEIPKHMLADVISARPMDLPGFLDAEEEDHLLDD